MTENQIRAKKFLDHIANLPREIESKMLEIEMMRAKAEGLRAIRYDKDHVQTSPADSMPEAVIKMLEFIDKLDEDHRALVRLRDRADTIMEYLEGEQRAVLDYYFFQGKNFYQIAKAMKFSERTAKRRYYEGLEVFGTNMSEYD